MAWPEMEGDSKYDQGVVSMGQTVACVVAQRLAKPFLTGHGQKQRS